MPNTVLSLGDIKITTTKKKKKKRRRRRRKRKRRRRRERKKKRLEFSKNLRSQWDWNASIVLTRCQAMF